MTEKISHDRSLHWFWDWFNDYTYFVYNYTTYVVSI